MMDLLNGYEYLPILFIILIIACMTLLIYFIISILRKPNNKLVSDENLDFNQSDYKVLDYNSITDNDNLEYQIVIVKNNQNKYRYIIQNISGEIKVTSRDYSTEWTCFKSLVNVHYFLMKEIIKDKEEKIKFGKINIAIKSNDNGQFYFVVLNQTKNFLESDCFESEKECSDALNKLKEFDFKPLIKSALSFIL